MTSLDFSACRTRALNLPLVSPPLSTRKKKSEILKHEVGVGKPFLSWGWRMSSKGHLQRCGCAAQGGEASCSYTKIPLALCGNRTGAGEVGNQESIREAVTGLLVRQEVRRRGEEEGQI